MGEEPIWLRAVTSAGCDAVSELERENAHFMVAEGLLEALDQLSSSRDDSDIENEEEEFPSL